MSSENNTWLLEVIAEVSMDAGIMFQFVCLNELEEKQKFRRHKLFTPLLCSSVCLFSLDYILQFIFNSLLSPFLHIPQIFQQI